MARPSKLNAITIKAIVDSIKLGASYALAAQSAGVSERTMYTWMAKGEALKKGAARDLYRAVKEAEGVRASTWLKRIEGALSTDWKAAAWKLERCYPELYGRYMRTELHGPKGGPIQQEVESTTTNHLDISKLSTEDLNVLEALLKKQSAATGSAAPGGSEPS